MIAGGTLEEEIERAKAKRQEGFEAFKVKVGSNSPEYDLKRCIMIRKALGSSAFISADANEGFTVPDKQLNLQNRLKMLELIFLNSLSLLTMLI